MKKLPKQVYTKEFKEEAVKLVIEEGLGTSEAAKRLSIPVQTYSKWLMNSRSGRMQNSGRGKEITEKDAEISRLRRENSELRMERDILKKATAYFANFASQN